MVKKFLKDLYRVRDLISSEKVDEAQKLAGQMKPEEFTPEEYYEVLFAIGETWYYGEHLDRAVEFFKKALGMKVDNKDEAECYIKIGDCLQEKECDGKAIECFNKAVSCRPTTRQKGQIYWGKGLSRENLKQYDKAIVNYKKVIKIYAPKSTKLEKIFFEDAYSRISACYWKLNQEAKADEYFNKLLSFKNPDREVLARAYAIKGHRIYEKENWQEAAKYYQKAIKLTKSQDNKCYWKDYLDYCKEKSEK